MNPDRKGGGGGGGGGWPEAPGGEQAWLTTWLMLLPDIKAIYIYTLIKKKIKFSSYIRKLRVEQLQSHI
jgi:hypothetical protein